MAFMFFAGKMASQMLDSSLSNALVRDSNDKYIAVHDGSLVVLGELAGNDVYNANGLEYDVYYAAAPAAVTDEVVIVDYAGISEGEIAGNQYKLGHKLVGIDAPAGRPVRVRRLHLHDKFWLGASNFASTPTVGKYATATASAFTHTPANSITAGQYNIKVLLSKDLTIGMRNDGLQYLCEVVEL